jgi:hypothetical protein
MEVEDSAVKPYKRSADQISDDNPVQEPRSKRASTKAQAHRDGKSARVKSPNKKNSNKDSKKKANGNGKPLQKHTKDSKNKANGNGQPLQKDVESIPETDQEDSDDALA